VARYRSQLPTWQRTEFSWLCGRVQISTAYVAEYIVQLICGRVQISTAYVAEYRNQLTLWKSTDLDCLRGRVQISTAYVAEYRSWLPTWQSTDLDCLRGRVQILTAYVAQYRPLPTSQSCSLDCILCTLSSPHTHCPPQPQIHTYTNKHVLMLLPTLQNT